MTCRRRAALCIVVSGYLRRGVRLPDCVPAKQHPSAQDPESSSRALNAQQHAQGSTQVSPLKPNKEGKCQFFSHHGFLMLLYANFSAIITGASQGSSLELWSVLSLPMHMPNQRKILHLLFSFPWGLDSAQLEGITSFAEITGTTKNQELVMVYWCLQARVPNESQLHLHHSLYEVLSVESKKTRQMGSMSILTLTA